ncbi:MAG TPA: hypothetical protein VMA95_13520 [Streptosporangiaceae bacterium]|nr:hypothetical protein [Streptosporangiaceae bacterium]
MNEPGEACSLAVGDPGCSALAGRLLPLATAILREGYLGGEFAFTLRHQAGGLLPQGTSTRYSIIACLGLCCLQAAEQREVLAGQDCRELLGVLASRLDDLTSIGDVALLTWAAAEAGHHELAHALGRLKVLDGGGVTDVVQAAWVVSALVAARPLADVEEHLAAARGRLLAARRVVFPHVTGGGPWYRAHVGSFADQVYPVQALARLHASADDQAALAAANQVAGKISTAQGGDGQWWWHYDARSGDVVEKYPVYSVHQHSMAPMALLDLASAGGDSHLGAIRAGLRWLTAPPETTQPLIEPQVPAIWRKVARGDPRKLVRGLAALTTAVSPGWSLPGIDRMFPPGAIDRECRPYESGWLLYAWLRGGQS